MKDCPYLGVLVYIYIYIYHQVRLIRLYNIMFCPWTSIAHGTFGVMCAYIYLCEFTDIFRVCVRVFTDSVSSFIRYHPVDLRTEPYTHTTKITLYQTRTNGFAVWQQQTHTVYIMLLCIWSTFYKLAFRLWKIHNLFDSLTDMTKISKYSLMPFLLCTSFASSSRCCDISLVLPLSLPLPLRLLLLLLLLL